MAALLNRRLGNLCRPQGAQAARTLESLDVPADVIRREGSSRLRQRTVPGHQRGSAGLGV